jgi:hypothetical protein
MSAPAVRDWNTVANAPGPTASARLIVERLRGAST